DGGLLFTGCYDLGTLYVWDLRAIHARLVGLGLGWDVPLNPPAQPVEPTPDSITVEGNLNDLVKSRQLVHQAHHLGGKDPAAAFQKLQEAIQLDPRSALAHNNLAWFLLTGPENLRGPTAALPLAQKAVELAPAVATYHNTLGVALCRTEK